MSFLAALGWMVMGLIVWYLMCSLAASSLLYVGKQMISYYFAAKTAFIQNFTPTEKPKENGIDGR